MRIATKKNKENMIDGAPLEDDDLKTYSAGSIQKKKKILKLKETPKFLNHVLNNNPEKRFLRQ